MLKAANVYLDVHQTYTGRLIVKKMNKIINIFKVLKISKSVSKWSMHFEVF